jgi:dihydroorotase
MGCSLFNILSMLKTYILFSLLINVWQASIAQSYKLVIKGGHVIDARNNIDEVMDIAVQDGKIVRVAKNIDDSKAIQVINARGLYVTPGLIDAHVHVFYGTDADRTYGNGPLAVIPDAFTFRTGVTTVVDAGSSGWRNFHLFKKQVIDLSQTRVLAFLNIVGEGMRGGMYEQDTRDMDGKLTGMTAKRYPDYIVGIKVAHFMGSDWTPVDEAVKAGKLADIPAMIDFGGNSPPLSIEELFTRHLRPGDIFTHCFGQLRDREAVVDSNTKKIKPFVLEAQQKGIAFDVGYGSISFAFSQAIPAFKSGFYPNSISTDIHANSLNSSMKDMLNVMSKFMSIGMSLQGVIQAATWNPAQEIKHEELGHLSEGAIADIAILNVRTGKFGFFDYTGYKVEGTKKLECEMTIKGGKIVYDLDGLATPMVTNKMGG